MAKNHIRNDLLSNCVRWMKLCALLLPFDLVAQPSALASDLENEKVSGGVRLQPQSGEGAKRSLINGQTLPENPTDTSQGGNTMWQEFQVNGETIRVDETDMQEIRQTVLQLLIPKEGEIYQFLRKELENPTLMLGSQGMRFGRWLLTERKDELVLIRIPPRRRMNYIYGATLKFEGGRWTATHLFEQRMWGKYKNDDK